MVGIRAGADAAAPGTSTASLGTAARMEFPEWPRVASPLRPPAASSLRKPPRTAGGAPISTRPASRSRPSTASAVTSPKLRDNWSTGGRYCDTASLGCPGVVLLKRTGSASIPAARRLRRVYRTVHSNSSTPAKKFSVEIVT